MPEDEAEYELIMPIMIVQSVGGPFDDEAFIAGTVCGNLDAELKVLTATPNNIPAIPGARFFDSRYLEQVDLIAMRHGYITDHEHVTDDGVWTYVAFARATQPGEEDAHTFDE